MISTEFGSTRRDESKTEEVHLSWTRVLLCPEKDSLGEDSFGIELIHVSDFGDGADTVIY